MTYKQYMAFYRQLCSDLRKRYQSADKSLIEESVSASIEKNLDKINWDEDAIADEIIYQSIYESARMHLRNLFKKLNRIQSFEEMEEDYKNNMNSKEDDEKILQQFFINDIIIKDSIERVTRRIPKQYKKIVELKLQGYNYKEISNETGLTEDNIKQRFCRFKKWAKKRELLPHLHFIFTIFFISLYFIPLCGSLISN
ncbi:MAG TPA: sigma factor-like helix-turn-helix DNA-binding protein [Candidatus Kapabacteria bacterium]|nr:sigma factor-like helix-turn-helix DNA-binding protein [Candidatus Kapabacteria bacterium]